MKPKAALALLAVPVLFAAYITLHPGVAFAESPLAKSLAPSAIKQAGNYTVDPVHTSIGFDIEHLGLSHVQGRFDKVAGSIHADPNNMKASGVSFTIQTDSVDTAVAPRDADLRSANFFDAAVNPEITFSSMRVSKRGKGYFAEGRLTMHGVTKPISFLFNAYGPIADPWKGRRIGIVSDAFVINREDFGMNADVPMVGSKVTVRISLEATLDK